MDCPAVIILKEVFVFNPEEGTSSKMDHMMAASAVRSDLSKGIPKIMVVFPNIKHENHSVGENAGLSQRIDEDVASKIEELVVEDGVGNVADMQRHLTSFVKKEVKPSPSRTNRRFMPTKKVIRYHMDKAAKRGSNSTDDQDNLVQLSFLMVYQTPEMQRLLRRYGNEMVLLDSTYKTCRFSLPLFFIAVKTNVDHQVVAAFITETESTAMIKEAIAIIKHANPDWNPTNYMTDNDEKEIGAMEFHFPDSRGLICDFHRVQAWMRWLKQTKNAITKKAEVLKCMKCLADAETEDEFDTRLRILRDSSSWASIGSYLETHWLPMKEKWAQYCRIGQLMVGVHTNNGIERLHGTFKGQFLKGNSKMTLTSTVRVLVKKFLPEKYQSYVEENLKLTGTYKQYAPEIPQYLHRRPVKFIEHCMKKIDLAKLCEPHNYMVQLGDDTTFPRCSCKDFSRTLLPCKHIFGRIMSGGTFQWEMVSSKYRHSPFLTADIEVNGKKEVSENTTVNDIVEEDMGADLDTTICFCETTPDNLEKGKQSVVSLQKRLREQLDLLRSKTYLCTDTSSLARCIQQLKSISESLTPMPKSSELPQLRKTPTSLKLRRKKKNVRFQFVDDAHSGVCSENSKDTVVVEDDVIYEGSVQEAASTSMTAKTLIPNPEIETIQQLWNLPRDYDVPVAKVCGTSVTDTDIRSLNDAGWLTDNILDTYLKLLVNELAAMGLGKVLHLLSSTMETLIRGARNHRPTYVLNGYKFAVGAYNRCSHWTLVVLDFEKKVIFFYNPVAEAESFELDSIRLAMCAFIAQCSNAPEADVRNQWRAGTMKHASQTDSFNCGVYCLMFAECHFNGRFQEMENINAQDLSVMRLSVAKKLLSFKEFLIDSCPKCGLTVDEADQKLQCDTCGRAFHFKPFCVHDDLALLNDGERFSCTLCRIGFWTNTKMDKGRVANSYEWIDKVQTLEDLHCLKHVDEDVVVTENATASLPCTSVETEEVAPETVHNKRLKRKKQRSSFIYTEIKRSKKKAQKIRNVCTKSRTKKQGTKKTYCVCKKPDNRRLYWQCGECEGWFHPSCVGEDIDDEPDIYVCHACKKQMTHIGETARKGYKEKEYKIPAIYQLTDEEDVESEAVFFITPETACNHMAAALERTEQIVSNRSDRGDIPWLQSSYKFRSGGVPQTHGYGWAVFSCVAIECVRFYIQETFLEEIESEPYFSTLRQVRGLQDEQLVEILSEDKYLVGAYMEHVLLREALAAIFQSLTGETYENADVECSAVLHRSTLKAMQAACALGAAKKRDLLKRHPNLTSKC